jgi:hypothetical protein
MFLRLTRRLCPIGAGQECGKISRQDLPQVRIVRLAVKIGNHRAVKTSP